VSDPIPTPRQTIRQIIEDECGRAGIHPCLISSPIERRLKVRYCRLAVMTAVRQRFPHIVGSGLKKAIDSPLSEQKYPRFTLEQLRERAVRPWPSYRKRPDHSCAWRPFKKPRVKFKKIDGRKTFMRRVETARPVIKEIRQDVARKWGISPMAISERSRRDPVIIAARAEVSAQARAKGISTPVIARLVGGFDHTTIIHLIREKDRLAIQARKARVGWWRPRGWWQRVNPKLVPYWNGGVAKDSHHQLS
jgi:hypothetical protein